MRLHKDKTRLAADRTLEIGFFCFSAEQVIERIGIARINLCNVEQDPPDDATGDCLQIVFVSGLQTKLANEASKFASRMPLHDAGLITKRALV
jgi:hypothetical protein